MTEKQALALLRPIIEACAKGQELPWRKSWRDIAAAGGLPANMARRKEYTGINTLVLLSKAFDRGYSSNWWLTYKQAEGLGGSIRKGERSTWVVFWKFDRKVEADDNGDLRETGKQNRVLCRCYNVFNLDQCDGINKPSIPEIETLPDHKRIAQCESIVAGYVDAPEIRTMGNQPLYSPAGDFVAMPLLGQFVSAETYYATLFHELIHSTGHDSRLHRDGLATYRKRNIQRNREELTAEMGAQLLCHKAQIALRPLEESAQAYCAGWGRRLREKPVEFVQAAQRARKAANWILGDRPKDQAAVNVHESQIRLVA